MSVEEKETNMAYETVTLQTLMREIAGRTSSNQDADAIRMAADTLDAFAADVRRDERVRAAEDAAAVPSIQHRDLPEQVALLWASVGDLIGRVVRLEGEMDAGADLTAERDAALRERDAAKEECERLRQSVRDTARVRDFWHQLCATREEELKALKARVAELEAAAAPAANAGGEKQEPVAWGVRRSDGTWWRDCRATRGEMLSVVTGGGDANNVVSPLYAGPPRGWLTADERELIAGLADDDVFTEEGQNIAKALLARETPPRVKMPPASTGETPLVRDLMWGEAIRAAGGEVAE